MTLSLVLDQITLPPKGNVKLQLNRNFVLNFSADEARHQVHDWLIDQVSCVIGAGEPTLFFAESEVYWRVPATLTATHMGEVGVAGHVDVNVETGVMDNRPECKKAILQSARMLAAEMPLYQPRIDMPEGYPASQLVPTITQPIGNPADIIAATD